MGDKMIPQKAYNALVGCQKGDREQSRILPKNYDFRLIGTDTSEGRAPTDVFGPIAGTGALTRSRSCIP
jgi:hypothetical protein